MSRFPRPRTRTAAVAVAVAGVLTLAGACGSPTAGSSGAGSSSSGGGGDTSPVKVGLVYSKTGALGTYGQQYIQGFTAGLDYATKGSGAVNGHKIEVVERDDAGEAAKAVAAATELIGQGVKIVAGSTASGVATQVAPLAQQNNVLFISGSAATDAVSGINKNTFQDILTAQSFIGDAKGKKVLVFTQDTAFGQANVAAVKAVIGDKGGATVTPLLVPASATDFTPFASQAKAAAGDLVFVAWAGTTAPAMWQALDQQGVLSATKVVTGLDQRSSYPTYGSSSANISFLSHFFPEAVSNDVAKAMADKVKAAGGTADIFTPDGFTAAQMIVRAVEKGNGDVNAMVKALEDWSFDGVKGKLTVRAADHALLQPMFQAKLENKGGQFGPALVKTLDPQQTAPPAK
jgi:branched-chain amino acid transport system substrate-binding protein